MFWPVSALIFFMLWTSGAQNIAKKRYTKCTYILFKLSWSAVSIGTGATSYKRLVQVSPVFSAFTESFPELLRVYSYTVVP